MTKDWREEFDDRFFVETEKEREFWLNRDGYLAPEPKEIKSFITSLIETERAAAVAEYQAKEKK